jgi:RNA polymerase sigma factor (sigma-70 family)
MKRFSGLIYSYILSVFSSRVPHQFKVNNTEDAFQDFFLFLKKDKCKKLRSYKGRNGCTLASWLRQVVINFSLDYTRKYRPQLSLDQICDGKSRIGDYIVDYSPSVKDKIFNDEMLKQLRESICRLKRDQRRLLELYLTKGIPADQLAKVFKVSRGAIDMRKNRIICTLRRRFSCKDLI